MTTFRIAVYSAAALIGLVTSGNHHDVSAPLTAVNMFAILCCIFATAFVWSFIENFRK